MRISVHAETETGAPVSATLSMSYPCPDCGYINELLVLNPYGRSNCLLFDGLPNEIMCHKCDHKNTLVLKVESES